MVELQDQGKVYRFSRPGLKRWLELDEILKEFHEAAEARDNNLLVDKLEEFVSAAFQIDKTSLDVLKWYEIAKAYKNILQEIKVKDVFPILQVSEETKNQDWGYKGRPWYFWLHLIASNYSWSKEYIAEMDIDDALGLYQEIMMKEHMQMEFQWSLSEIAYPYNASSKKQEYKEFPKLPWMLSTNKSLEPKKIKILKSTLPVGNVVMLGAK